MNQGIAFARTLRALDADDYPALVGRAKICARGKSRFGAAPSLRQSCFAACSISLRRIAPQSLRASSIVLSGVPYSDALPRSSRKRLLTGQVILSPHWLYCHSQTLARSSDRPEAQPSRAPGGRALLMLRRAVPRIRSADLSARNHARSVEVAMDHRLALDLLCGVAVLCGNADCVYSLGERIGYGPT
jgi:hypothetical protein